MTSAEWIQRAIKKEPKVSIDLFGLLKIGQRKHIDALFQRGEMFFQTLGFFRALEHEPERGDPNEAIRRIYTPSGIQSLKVLAKGDSPQGGLDITRGLASPLRIWVDADADLNVFCMYAIIRPGTLVVDPRCARFGDTFLLIRDVRRFLRRIEIRAGDVASNLSYGPVAYVPERRYVGDMHPFKKFDKYAHQSEFRFVVAPGHGKPLTLTIGSLEGIATIGSVAQLLRDAQVHEGTNVTTNGYG